MDSIRKLFLQALFSVLIPIIIAIVVLLVFTFGFGWKIQYMEIPGIGVRLIPPDASSPVIELGQRPQQCYVPEIRGFDESTAITEIKKTGLSVIKTVTHNSNVPAGVVISQSPIGETFMSSCQGQVNIEVSLGALPIPTNTPMPTPDLRLFWDDFENTLRPEWGFMDKNYAVSNGQLAVDSGRLSSATIGNSTWGNYRVRLLGLASHTFIVRTRIQDADNYLALGCWPNSGLVTRRCEFGRVVNGNWATISGTGTEHRSSGWGSGDNTFPIDIEVEVQGDVYRFFLNGEQQLRFVDNTYASGGILFYADGRIRLESFEVISLP